MGKKVFLDSVKYSFSKALLSGSGLIFHSFWCLVLGVVGFVCVLFYVPPPLPPIVWMLSLFIFFNCVTWWFSTFLTSFFPFTVEKLTGNFLFSVTVLKIILERITQMVQKCCGSGSFAWVFALMWLGTAGFIEKKSIGKCLRAIYNYFSLLKYFLVLIFTQILLWYFFFVVVLILGCWAILLTMQCLKRSA